MSQPEEADEHPGINISPEGDVEIHGDVINGDQIKNFQSLFVFLGITETSSETKEIVEDFQKELLAAQHAGEDVFRVDVERVYSALRNEARKLKKEEIFTEICDWLGPLIKKYQVENEAYMPYAYFINDLISNIPYLNHIKTVFLTDRLLYQDSALQDAVYLRTLSKYFPQKGLFVEPDGFYLVAHDPPKRGTDKRWGERNDVALALRVSAKSLAALHYLSKNLFEPKGAKLNVGVSASSDIYFLSEKETNPLVKIYKETLKNILPAQGSDENGKVYTFLKMHISGKNQQLYFAGWDFLENGYNRYTDDAFNVYNFRHASAKYLLRVNLALEQFTSFLMAVISDLMILRDEAVREKEKRDSGLKKTLGTFQPGQ